MDRGGAGTRVEHRPSEGRQAHLAGPIAAALMAEAPELLAAPPVIERVDLVAAK